ncbi:MAG: hypothetical protein IJ575_09790 [Selenomonadaceae bacterium]|nr:hypothetical protein [Selenomonadaceae bacterium]
MKQKVLLYTEKGSSDPNINLFRRDFFYRNFEPIAIVSNFGGGGKYHLTRFQLHF